MRPSGAHLGIMIKNKWPGGPARAEKRSQMANSFPTAKEKGDISPRPGRGKCIENENKWPGVPPGQRYGPPGQKIINMRPSGPSAAQAPGAKELKELNEWIKLNELNELRI